MAKSPDHPELNYVQASGYSKGRPDGPPLWIVVHDMEAGESGDRAESTAAYFASGAGGRSVSSHYCVDDNSVVQCVRLGDVAWTVGNRPGNNRGINWEFAGYARQTRAQWLDEFGLAMFREAAPIMRADAVKFGIPLRRCTVADLKAFRPGVTSHNDLRLAFGQTTHTDPGPNFPWDVFMQILEDDMPVTAAEIAAIATASAKAVHNQLLGGSAVTVGMALQTTLALANQIAKEVNIDAGELAAIKAAAEAGVVAAVDRFVAAVMEKLPASTDLTEAQVEAAVRAAFERGLAPDA